VWQTGLRKSAEGLLARVSTPGIGVGNFAQGRSGVKGGRAGQLARPGQHGTVMDNTRWRMSAGQR